MNVTAPSRVVLIADVRGSSKLHEKAGEAAARAAMEKCVAVLQAKAVEAKGRVVKANADGMIAAFQDADSAAGAAIEMQRAVSAMPPVGDTRLGAGIGLAQGAAIEQDGNVVGDAVNLAARLAGIATKGVIITTHDTVVLMSPMLKVLTRAFSTMQAKGEKIPVYDLKWEEEEDYIGPATAIPQLRETSNATLRLVVEGVEVILSPERPAVSIGRDVSAGLVIKEPNASRAHGKIERLRGKFVLTDHSANGTFITIEGDKEIKIRQEQFTLHRHGWLAFGQSRANATDVVEFFCQT